MLEKRQTNNFFWVNLFLVLTLFTSVLVTALPKDSQELKELGKKTITIDSDGRVLEKIVFVHYKEDVKSIKKEKKDSCYSLMGPVWPTLPVTYTINPTNSQGLSEEFITSSVSSAAEAWDKASHKELFNNSYVVDYSARYGLPRDAKNTITFGEYPNDYVIAITAVWYYRAENRIVEFDQMYNTRMYWGNATANPGVMDLQNIVTHELGHGIGLNDLYTPDCSDATMYGYASYGETSKLTIEKSDKNGLKELLKVSSNLFSQKAKN